MLVLLADVQKGGVGDGNLRVLLTTRRDQTRRETASSEGTPEGCGRTSRGVASVDDVSEARTSNPTVRVE